MYSWQPPCFDAHQNLPGRISGTTWKPSANTAIQVSNDLEIVEEEIHPAIIGYEVISKIEIRIAIENSDLGCHLDRMTQMLIGEFAIFEVKFVCDGYKKRQHLILNDILTSDGSWTSYDTWAMFGTRRVLCTKCGRTYNSELRMIREENQTQLSIGPFS